MNSEKNKPVSKKNEAILNAKSFDELLDVQYGKIGSKKRDGSEEKAQYFVISETLKDTSREARLTQEQLAEKAETKKSYISLVKNGKYDVRLSALYKIFKTDLADELVHLLAEYDYYT